MYTIVIKWEYVLFSERPISHHHPLNRANPVDLSNIVQNSRGREGEEWERMTETSKTSDKGSSPILARIKHKNIANLLSKQACQVLFA